MRTSTLSGNVTGAFVAYDNAAKSKGHARWHQVTATAVALSNVAAGQLTSTSSDAVNGSQLYGAAKSVAAALGGGTTVNANGTLAGPAYALNGTTYNDVGSALAAVNANPKVWFGELAWCTTTSKRTTR